MNKNINITTIQHRLLNIKKLMDKSNLHISNPLNGIDADANTECFCGPVEKDGKSMDTKAYLGKKKLNFYKVINNLNTELHYIKSGAYGNTFKGVVHDDFGKEIMSIAVKVVPYPKKDGYGKPCNTTRPENAEICMLKVLSYFVIKNQTPHIILPISTFDTDIKPFLTLQNEKFIPQDNKNYREFVENYHKDKYYKKVSVIISEWADRQDLGMFLKKNYKSLNLKQWQCIFFQILSTLAIIQLKYPKFKHNDFKANNILVSQIKYTNFKTLYRVNNKDYLVPCIGYFIYLWDFDFACIEGIVENSKVNQAWTSAINITSKQNRYYDIHYFFCTLIYKGFLPDLMTEPRVPIEVKNFINYVLPEEYRPKHKFNYVNDRCRLQTNDEIFLPIDLLNHSFFASFA